MATFQFLNYADTFPYSVRGGSVMLNFENEIECGIENLNIIGTQDLQPTTTSPSCNYELSNTNLHSLSSLTDFLIDPLLLYYHV